MKAKNSTKSFDPYDFSKVIYDKVPVYHKNFPTSPCIHINICFGVGVLNDPEEISGVSHFLEHMIFDGSPKLPNKKIITEWKKINALGTWNAWTFYSNTNYHLKCLPEKFDTVLEGMEDMIFHPLLRPEDVEHERQVITQEAWSVYKNEKLVNYLKEYLNNTYKGTARQKSMSPLGWPDTIAKISHADIQKWHKDNYGKGNFFIVISGNIDDKHLKKIKELIKRLPKSATKKVEYGKLSKPLKQLIVKTGDEIGDPKEQVEISFERPMLPKDAPSEEIQLMAGSLFSDLLFERLRTERALCYSVGAGAMIQKEFISWGASLKTKEGEVDTVKKEFWKALNDIIAGKEKKRFEVLKQVRLDRIKSVEQVTGDFTNEALTNVCKFGKIVTKKSIIAEREEIKYSDVVKCLKIAFDKKLTVTEVILPTKK